MDYEKKYKEALERAKKCHKDMSKLDGVTANMAKDFFEEIFPELKENEDDNMREMAIKAVYAPEAQSCIKSWGVNPDDVIAWLEKQGEKESDPRYENLEEILAADDIYQMSMNDEMVQEAKEKAVNALSGMCIGRLLGLEKQYIQKPIISNNALREGIAHFGITQYQINNWLKKIDNWLKKYVDVEKQGEQILANSAKTCKDGYSPKFRVGDTIKCKYDDRQFTIKSVDFNKGTYTYTQEGCGNDIDYADEEFELVEQKPDDKVETKFKAGDWITNSIETVQITGYDIDYGYQVDYKGNLQHRDTDIIEKEYHLWTIQDAKDGDVLYYHCSSTDFSLIGIFKRVAPKYELYGGTYRNHVQYGGFGGIENHTLQVALGKNDLHHCGTIACPATKEQRERLFQKMHEAGYEWDAEKKLLKPLFGKYIKLK